METLNVGVERVHLRVGCSENGRGGDFLGGDSPSRVKLREHESYSSLHVGGRGDTGRKGLVEAAEPSQGSMIIDRGDRVTGSRQVCNVAGRVGPDAEERAESSVAGVLGLAHVTL